MTTEHNHKALYFLIGLAVLVNFSGLFVPLMDPDAGVYASISKTMAQQNDFVNLYFQETDWLDKPHFPFWVTAVFFKALGYHDWVYKLPGVLFVLMGAGYTYLFTRKYYNKTVALWSAFILLTAMHIIISNNDVRAEPYLTGLIIAAIYHFSLSLSAGFNRHLLFACLFTACAVMTKGIFTLIPIGGAVAGQLIIKQQWKQVFHWRWFLALLLITVFISPELYCLWKQFDTHPEKTVLGDHNVSGIKFFLWDSQFGRFFNTGPIKGKGDKLFFLHTLLWAFLPWSLIMYAALFNGIKSGVKRVKDGLSEWYTLTGSLLTLLLFSFSGFQLPHYSNIIFPLLAIPSAHFIWQLVQRGEKTFPVIQNVLSILLVVMGTALLFFYRPAVNFIFITVIILILALLILLPRLLKPESGYVPFLRSGIAVLAIGLFLNLSFYPDLLKYQSGNEVASYMNKHQPGESLARISIYYPSGEFYLRGSAYRTSVDAIVNGGFTKTSFLFITEEEKKQLEEKGIRLAVIKSFKDFHVTRLSLKFLDPKKRETVLKNHYLVRVP